MPIRHSRKIRVRVFWIEKKNVYVYKGSVEGEL